MISRLDLEERVREWSLREEVVEKDYVIGWVLWGIGSDPTLSSKWAFKGGTCLKKCYIETYRFSEDLDFTVLPGGPVAPIELSQVFRSILERVSEASGIDFTERPPLFKTGPIRGYTEGRIYYKGPRGATSPTRIKLDISASEKVLRPTVQRPIGHAYPDALPEPGEVRCYAFEEVFAEKIRAMGERGRPRDLYDIINLFRRTDLGIESQKLRELLKAKCASKGVDVPTIESITASENRVELESEWENMLAHQLPALPDLADFWAELPELFAWLEGKKARMELQAAPAVEAQSLDTSWSPPSTITTWGAVFPLETIRFAAVNRLCVDLGYNGTKRLIEPYSLRRTQDGNLLIYALRAESREIRAYRVDRVQSASVTTKVFSPAYRVEFSSSSAVAARPTSSNPRRGKASRRSGLAHGIGTTYVIECPFCHKRFRRKRLGNTRLGDHKNNAQQRCPGSRGNGYLIATRYS